MIIHFNPTVATKKISLGKKMTPVKENSTILVERGMYLNRNSKPKYGRWAVTVTADLLLVIYQLAVG